MPPIFSDHLSINSDRSVWSHRHGRLVHDAGEDTSVLAERLKETGISRLLLLGFGAGAALLHVRPYVDSITICEQFPPSLEALPKLFSSVAMPQNLSQQIIEQWPPLVNGLHRLQLCDPHSGQRPVELTLAWGEPASTLRELTGPFDLICCNPGAGGLALLGGNSTDLAQLRRLSRPHTCVLGLPDTSDLSSSLQTHGLKINSAKSTWFGTWRGLRSVSGNGATETTSTPEHVIVLGAGIAGLSIARELAIAGCQVTVLERQDQALLGGSAQAALAGHLHFSADDNFLARLTRAAQALQTRLNLASKIGRLQVLPDATAVESAQQMFDRLALPPHLATIVDADQGADLAGFRIGAAAIWQSASRILMPGRLRSELPDNLILKTGIDVHGIKRLGDQWALLDRQDQTIASAPVLVLCTGTVPLAAQKPLIPAPSIATRFVVGQSTIVSDKLSSRLRCVVGGEHYACPLPDGSVLTGASYRHPPPGTDALAESAIDTSVRVQERQANVAAWHHLTRAERAQAGARNDHSRIMADLVGLRHTTIDHLPVIGPLPDEHAVREQWQALHRDDRIPVPVLPGVFMAGGFGSRGSLWSALAAAMIRDLVKSAQPPIERSLIAAIEPQRFLRRAIRRYSSPEACTMSTPIDSTNAGHATRTAHE